MSTRKPAKVIVAAVYLACPHCDRMHAHTFTDNANAMRHVDCDCGKSYLVPSLDMLGAEVPAVAVAS